MRLVPLFLANTNLGGGCTRQPLGEQRGTGTHIDYMAVKALRQVPKLQVKWLTTRISDHAAIVVDDDMREGR